MTPKASLIGVLLSIVASTTVSFLVAAVFVRAQQPEADEADALGEATRKMKAMKGAKPETAAAKKPGGELMAVRNIVVACDAGMGSSAMGAGLLRKRVQAAGLDISVTNRAIDQLDDQVDWVITHKDLDRAGPSPCAARPPHLADQLPRQRSLSGAGTEPDSGRQR
jgi:PTS system mannitol-specific IIC component